MDPPDVHFRISTPIVITVKIILETNVLKPNDFDSKFQFDPDLMATFFVP